MDEPLAAYEIDELMRAGWKPDGGGVVCGVPMPAFRGPDGTRVQATRREWRAMLERERPGESVETVAADLAQRARFYDDAVLRASIAAALRATHAAGRAEGLEAGAQAIRGRLDASLGPLSERAALADAISIVRALM